MEAVLIVDDDPIYIQVARAIITATGTKQISSVSDGTAARAALVDGRQYDLLLLDLNMPNYDGLEFLKYLRQISFGGAIIIVSAAHVSVQESAAKLGIAYGLHIAGVLRKPLTLRKLVPAMAQIQPQRRSGITSIF